MKPDALEVGGEETGLEIIDSLEVSESWKRTFAIIGESEPVFGLVPTFKNPLAARKGAKMNYAAFFLGPLYYFYLGMHRKGLTLLGMAMCLGGLFEVLAMPDAVIRGASIGFNMIFAMSANADYYRKKVRGEEFWV